jgi:hypothetical protein
MPNVFIAYRRQDTTAGWAALIHERLSEAPGAEVFMDVDSLPYGADFELYIQAMLQQCDVTLVLIGSDWLTAVDAGGNRRLEDPKDVHRFEIAEALRLERVRVIPVLFGSVRMPEPDQLPDDIRPLVKRHAFCWHLDQPTGTQLKDIAEAVSTDRRASARAAGTARHASSSSELSAQVLPLCDELLQSVTDQGIRRELQWIKRGLRAPISAGNGILGDATRANAGLTSLEKLAWDYPPLDSLAERVERLREEGPNMLLLDLAKWYERCSNGEIELPEDRLADLTRLLTNDSAVRRLNIAPGAGEREVRAAAAECVLTWRAFEASPSASPMAQRVASDAVRFYEALAAPTAPRERTNLDA